MDRSNNALGISIGSDYPNASINEIKQYVTEALKQGKAVYIPNPPGAGVNSPAQLSVRENGPVMFTSQHPDIERLGNTCMDVSSFKYGEGL